MIQKLGRNDTCHCGSGLKYKRCCLKNGVLPSDRVPSTISLASQQESQKRLVKRAQKNMGDGYTLLQESLPTKMSAIILDLADFLLKAASTKQQEHSAISIACLAWNMSILDSMRGQESLDDFFKDKDDPDFKTDVEDIIGTMIAKKRHYYPDINRIIVDFELLQNKKNIHLTIMSIVPEEEAAKAKLLA
jgi:hypothetical protein